MSTHEPSSDVVSVSGRPDGIEPGGEHQRLLETCRRCGLGPHPTRAGVCVRNHWMAGNRAAAKRDEQTAADWANDAQAQEELIAALLRDEGTDAEHAPRKLLLTVRTIAQAERVTSNAYKALVRVGGPFTSTGRIRREFVVWSSAAKRLERQLARLGKTKPPGVDLAQAF